jgi:hypothetical protein
MRFLHSGLHENILNSEFCAFSCLVYILVMVTMVITISFIHPSMALQPFVGPCPLLQFRNLFTQSVGLLGRGISPSQGNYLYTGQHKHRINSHTDIHAPSGIRTHDPSVRESEDISCLRERSHRDQHYYD